MRRFSMKNGGYGPKVPLSRITDQGQIDLLNAVQEETGEPLDLFLPSAEGGGPAVDMSDPDTQHMIASLDEEIKRGIEERGGKVALQQALDENGDLKW